MKRTAIFATLWITSLALVYFYASDNRKPSLQAAGDDAEIHVVTVEADPEIVVISGQRPSESLDHRQATLATDASAPNPYRETDSSGGEGLQSSDIASTLPDALNSSDRIAQNLIVAHMLSQLTAENALSMLAAFENTKKNSLTDHHFLTFMYAWGKVDGKAATEYAFKQNDGRKVKWGGTSALSAWAEQNPAEVYDYLGEQDPRVAEQMHGGFMVGYAKANIGEAQLYAASMEPGRLRGGAIDVLMHQHRESGDRGSMLEWASQTLATNDDPNFIKAVLGKTTMEAAKNNGVELAQWLDRNATSDYVTPQMFEEAADEWAETNPRAAASWLEGKLDDPRVTDQVVGEFTDEWAKVDPEAAASWIDAHLGSKQVSSKVTGRAAGEWAANDPAGALEWVGSLPQNMQATSYGYIARQWPSDDIDSAINWLDSSGGDKNYDSAREGVASRLANDDPAQAIRVASNISDTKTRERSIVRSAQTMIRKGDAEAVRAWLPVSGLSPAAQAEVFKRQNNRDRRG